MIDTCWEVSSHRPVSMCDMTHEWSHWGWRRVWRKITSLVESNIKKSIPKIHGCPQLLLKNKIKPSEHKLTKKACFLSFNSSNSYETAKVCVSSKAALNDSTWRGMLQSHIGIHPLGHKRQWRFWPGSCLPVQEPLKAFHQTLSRQ